MHTVLVVDDEPFLRLTVVDVLADDGFAVLEAASGPEADQIFDQRADIDTLVTDIRMPGDFDGAELARRALAKRPDLKVLIMSGWFVGEVDDLPPSARLLKKPFDLFLLAKEVRALWAS